MSNQERLEEYLVGEKGYLKNDISNGKVIMLSGKWGSGKTHFWQNIIAKDLIDFQTKKQKAYVYTSLYGNRTIDKIEDNIYAQAYLCSVGGKNAVLSGYETVKDFGKRFGSFCSLLDVSKLIDGLDDIQQKNIKRSALSYLENGGIVCFDDFERKSKDIDLNDLFGFISHLAIDLKCKVVIILNDDVFEGVEKDVFSRVKEKSVSKFLKYEPSIEELFNLIFDEEIEKDGTKEKKYKDLESYREIILKTIEETQELNARIYIQVLDNLFEWIDKKQEDNHDILRCLILVNINFILNHNIFIIREIKRENAEKISILEIKNFLNLLSSHINLDVESFSNYHKYIDSIKNNIYGKQEKSYDSSKELLLKLHPRNLTQLKVNELIAFIDDNELYFKSIYFGNKLKISKDIDDKTFHKINNFIETGILINE